MRILPLIGWLSASALVWCQSVPPQVTCTSSKPTVTPGEAIGVNAWSLADGANYRWSADGGVIHGQGTEALWDFTDTLPGSRLARVEVMRGGSLIGTCSVRVFVREETGVRGLKSRRFLDEPNRQSRGEGEVFGLYSYLLLRPAREGSATADLNRSVLETWHQLVLTATELERSRDRRELNAVLVPVDELAPEKPDVNWIVQHYDYRRAGDLLTEVRRASTKEVARCERGPCLVSSAQPLNATRRGTRLLVFDISWAPVSTAPYWLEAFVHQGEQERFDDARTLPLFALKLRTIISVLADSVPIPEARRDSLLATVVTGR